MQTGTTSKKVYNQRQQNEAGAITGLLIQKEERHRSNQVRISFNIKDMCF